MLSINQNFIDKIYQHSLDEFPNECCGILAGKNNNVSNIYLVKNTAKSPYRYLMDSKDLLDADKDTRDKNIDFIVKLPNLRFVDVTGCDNLKNIDT